MHETEQIICAVLRGEARPWVGPVASAAIARFIDAARYHGVLPLLDAELTEGRSTNWPAEILAACREESRAWAMYELAHRVEMFRVLNALSSAGVTFLILKGAALAYSLYPTPTLRPHSDTDLLIHPDRRKDAALVLERLGYSKSRGGEGAFTFHQATWHRPEASGAVHTLDVHWRISNSSVLSRPLTYAELEGRAASLPPLGPHARTLAPADALLFACIHRAGHAHAPYFVNGVPHFGIDRLIWLYDIRLLVSQMSAGELDAWAATAAAKGIGEICCDAILRTRERFGTVVPRQVLELLSGAEGVEPSARFLSAGRVRLMLDDVRALRGWGERIAWARELAFPSASYMRWKYADASITWLPGLYLQRAVTGTLGLFRSRDAERRH
jgi:hypothetical protein